MDRDESVTLAIRALGTAISDDTTSSVSGPDLSRGLYPAVTYANSHGVTRFPTEKVAVLAKQVVDQIAAESDREEARS